MATEPETSAWAAAPAETRAAATSVFLSTAKDQPIHMWDAFTGSRRAQYAYFTDAEELTAAYCVAFSSTGDSIFGGFNNAVREWKLSRPGRTCVSYPTYRRSNKVRTMNYDYAF